MINEKPEEIFIKFINSLNNLTNPLNSISYRNSLYMAR